MSEFTRAFRTNKQSHEVNRESFWEIQNLRHIKIWKLGWKGKSRHMAKNALTYCAECTKKIWALDSLLKNVQKGSFSYLKLLSKTEKLVRNATRSTRLYISGHLYIFMDPFIKITYSFVLIITGLENKNRH